MTGASAPGEPPVTLSHRVNNYRFRDECLLYLRDQGFTTADVRSEVKGLTRQERLQLDLGDIVGLPFVIGCRAQRNLDLSGSLDQAKEEARRAGVSVYASIQQRRGRRIEEAYVTMPLHVFADVLRRYDTA